MTLINCVKHEYYRQDVYIYIAFRTPADIDTNTGMYSFAKEGEESPFSGIYKVVIVENVFEEGIFKQNLTCLRMPGQSIDYDNQPLNIDSSNQLATQTTVKKKPKESPADLETQAKNVVANIFGIDPSAFPPPEPASETDNLPEKRVQRVFGTSDEVQLVNYNIDRSQPSRIIDGVRVFGSSKLLDELEGN